EWEGGRWSVKGDPDSGRTIAEIAWAAHSNLELPDGVEGQLDATCVYNPPNLTYPFGAYICVVDVDPGTGKVDVRRFIAVDDCGVRINPMIVEGQVHGGLADGIGMALMESIAFDADGNCLGGSFMDYLLPTSLECPSWELGATVTPSPHHPIGAKGVGESATVGSPPAVVNAVVDALFLAGRMGQPILREGEPGVGETEAAKALAAAIDTPLVRLQCYEGITASEALYEWNYPRQLLAIRLAEAAGEHIEDKDLFTSEYLLPRPLLTALLHPGPRPAVLLIDEVDRADDEFEAFLFELLAEAAVTIPELGTQQAALPPVTVLTSNRTRDLHDALTRRCLSHWIAYPDTARVAEIVRRRVPASGERLSGQIATAVGRLRSLDLTKPP